MFDFICPLKNSDRLHKQINSKIKQRKNVFFFIIETVLVSFILKCFNLLMRTIFIEILLKITISCSNEIQKWIFVFNVDFL